MKPRMHPAHNSGTPKMDPREENAPSASLNAASIEAAAEDKASISEESHQVSERRPMGRRLWKAFISTPRGIHLVLLVICFSLGFALASQVISQRSDPLDSLSQEDLVVLLEELTSKEEALRSERANLLAELSVLENEATQRQAALDGATKARELAEINAALVPVEGPGVVMTVVDPVKSLSTTHFVMALGELRNAGAEAVALNGIRLTMRSSFSSDANGVYLDGKPLASPYRWEVIGEPDTIATALEIQAGSAAQMRAKGSEVTIRREEKVTIRSVAPPIEPQWAKVQ